MSKRPCAELAEQRSAFVDGALVQDDSQRLLRHLAGCAACRHDVAGLQVVRELISRAPSPHPSAPADLSARLVSIASSEHDEPTGGRAFRRTDPVLLSRGRRNTRWRATIAGIAVAASVTIIGATGYLAAPSVLATVSDPSAEAEAEFSAAVGRSPLHGDSVGAMLVANRVKLGAGANTPAWEPAEPAGDQVNSDDARTLLEQAVLAADAVGYVGEQIFTARGRTENLTAQLRVVNLPGRGSQVSVVHVSGSPVLSGPSPTATATRLGDTGLLRLLVRNYVLSGVHGSSVLGRPATMLQASKDGVPASRWWVDDDTGLVLWQQTYDAAGHLQVSVGFSELDLTSTRSPLGAPTLPTASSAGPASTTSTALTLSNAQPMASAGWFCSEDLSGLSLVKLRADRAADPRVVNLTYSDGLHTVTVHEQLGLLGADPATFDWDDGMAAYLRRGSSNLATWQSGDRVFTVMTDGSAAQLAQVVDVLPHDAPRERTTVERIQAGWAKILAEVRG